jgi:transposase
MQEPKTIKAEKLSAYRKREPIPQITPAKYKEVDSLALANVQLQLEKAFRNHLKNPKHLGLPKFKRKRDKAEWYGRTFIQADRFFPSSKLCHCCRYKKEDLTLYERTWTCPVCGRAHDRDVNASINLYFVGLEQSEVKPVERRGESLCEAGSSIFYKVEWFTEFSSYLQGRNYIESATLDKRTNNMI